VAALFAPLCPASPVFLSCLLLQDCLPRLLPVAANEFHVPSTTICGCIRVTVSGINILPGRPIPRREGISPAQIVPVIDVLLQGDQLYIPVKRFLGQHAPAKHPLVEQLEQPSDVNSSTTTGVRAVPGVLEDDGAPGRIKATSRTEKEK